MTDSLDDVIATGKTMLSDRQKVEALRTTLMNAETWLSGWASAEPYLSEIRETLKITQ